ncbi:hypothetical protein KUCAC02_015319 [Chaenocephalus aceratus]|uniref:Uncharacterized protein n=1 Tax=Chaenocephalus aceratus TaxID=36190 RepID=A0ACB9XYP5_CHAAC|nr:hypothetical protein KUCAC02_015319 [Chaenocephalus aceratus]
MAVLLGSYSIALFGTSFVIATLTYITYRLLSDYLHKWFTMKPIPELEGTYPIIGNALIFKNNPGDFFALAPVASAAEDVDPHLPLSILTEFLEVMNEQAEILVEKLEKQAGKGPFNCFNHITLCALDIICETAMGKKIHAQSNSDSEYVKSVMSDIISRRQRTPWFWPNFVYNYFGDGREHDRTLKVLHSFTNKVIHERSEKMSHIESDNDSGLWHKEEDEHFWTCS